MLTRNGKLCFGANGSSQAQYKAVTGGALQSYTGQSFQQTTRIFVGTGTTPVTVDDFHMESNATSSFNISGEVMTYPSTFENSDYLALHTATFTNITASPITITELAVEYTVYEFFDDYTILVAHEIIDPTTIAPGESKTFTVKIG